MAKFCSRRQSDPYFVHALRDAILKISQQKQCPNEQRVLRSVLQEYEWTKSEILKQLKLAVKDELILQVTAMSYHGASKGIPQTAYRVAAPETEEEELSKETHDWYCWKCHKSGEVILCDNCPRVFHRKCAQGGTASGNKWKCPSCQLHKLPPLMERKSSDEITKLLKFTLERMKEKAKEYMSPISLKEHPDYLEFVFKPMDLGTLQKLVEKKTFKTPKEFREESQWMLHNAIVYFGDDDDMTDLAEAIMEDCDEELEEMWRCADCYMMSNVRSNDWFCKPCFKPHEVVWAKMTGEPPWPAKLLDWSEDKSKALVRFFGTAHQRAWVGQRSITPITEKPDVKKRPRAWLLACDEVQKYQAKVNPEAKTKASPGKPTAGQTKTFEKRGRPPKIPKTASCVTQTEKCLEEEHRNKEEEEEREKEREKVRELEIQNDQGKSAITELENTVSELEQKLESVTADLKSEQERSRQLVDSAQKREERILRERRPVVEFALDNNNLQGKVDNSQTKADMATLREQAQLLKEQSEKIKSLQETVIHEREEKKTLAEKVLKDADKAKEREMAQAVKRALNKERLDRERTVDEAVKKALEKAKQEKEKQLQRSLQVAKEEAEKSLQEAVSLTKKKQWCAHCRHEAFYPCCWNTSYCTPECQKAHWCTHRFHCMRVACNCGRECQKTHGFVPPLNQS